MNKTEELELHWERYTEGKRDFKEVLHEFCQNHNTTVRKISIMMADEDGGRYASINSELSRGNLSEGRLKLLIKVLTKIEERARVV